MCALIAPPTASAAVDTQSRTHPVNPVDQLQVTTTANCVLAEAKCYFDTAANLLTPQGPTGFPSDLWARQTTTIRSMDQLAYMETQVAADNTRLFKSGGSVEITTIFFGGGPPEKFRIHGTTEPTNWATGQPKLDADYIVCATIQVVYSGVNIQSPQTCSQTTFS